RLDRRLRRDPFEPLELMARPGELALGVVPGVEFGAFGGRGKLEVPFQMRDEMPDPMCAHDGQLRVELATGEGLDFVERALFQHRVEAGVDAAIERLALRCEEEAGPFFGPERRRRARPMERGERPA